MRLFSNGDYHVGAGFKHAALFAESRLPLQQGLPEYRVSLDLFEHRLVLNGEEVGSRGGDYLARMTFEEGPSTIHEAVVIAGSGHAVLECQRPS